MINLPDEGVLASQAMAASSQPLAVEAALKIMAQGGHAVDAAIAANAVLALTEPTGCGLGGDLFAFIWQEKSRKLWAYNGSGRSPKKLTRQVFKNLSLKEIPAQGPLAISVPGCVEAWETIHKLFGHLNIKSLLTPAIELAFEGFQLTPVIAQQWARGSQKLKDQSGFAEIFLPPGFVAQAGEVFHNLPLGQTFNHLAQNGFRDFYEGELADKIARYCHQVGGYLSTNDLADHRGNWITPLACSYREVEVWQIPPNSQGLAVLQMLNLFECFEIENWQIDSVDYWHLFTEIKKIVFEDRARWYADPDFVKIPLNELISKDYAHRQKARIDRQKAQPISPLESSQLQQSDTIYLTIADPQGNMVSWIQSNYMGFGSGVTIPELGFGLQNRGQLFNLTNPQHPNAYAPGKRPFHTIIPGFVTRQQKPLLAFGVMGGDFQPQGQVQILQHLLDRKLGLQEAGHQPRLQHLGSSTPTGTFGTGEGTVYVEDDFSDQVSRQLEKRGHQIKQGDSLMFGGYQGIWKMAKGWRGATEPRKDGLAKGF